MACSNPFDVLRLRSEDLGPTLYVKASWKDPWLNIVPRAEYPQGAGLVRSSFQVGRSEPTTDEETWNAIAVAEGGTHIGSCGVTYNDTYVGEKETTYKPEVFGLRGPDVCQDDLAIYWESEQFWMKYFEALEKRNIKSITNRLENIYMNYATKVVPSTTGHVTEYAGDVSTQPPSSSVDLSAISGANLPGCGLTQDILDDQAAALAEEGADVPNSNGWITQGESGPEFPLLIGQEASNQLLLNNAELRSDYRQAFMGWGDANLVIQRIGASRIIKNFRHIITRFPARWGYTGGALYRVPRFRMSTASADATLGRVAIVNPDWQNPDIAGYEAAVVLNPWVFTERILRPVNAAPGMKWQAQNYFGEWHFVTGNDAFLGMDSCAGIADPMHKRGRHFAEYRHAAEPIFANYGRVILFKRCPSTIDCVTCS